RYAPHTEPGRDILTEVVEGLDLKDVYGNIFTDAARVSVDIIDDVPLPDLTAGAASVVAGGQITGAWLANAGADGEYAPLT
ncbi:hypothetical protein OFC37_35840, partial [Escherichia coli]|nr:hypothetical protein [Escherichia coli]